MHPLKVLTWGQTIAHAADTNGFLVERGTPMASIKGDPVFSHVIVGVDGLDASRRFDDALLGTLGIRPGVNAYNGNAGRCLSRLSRA